MYTEKITLKSELGLHAKPASLLVKEASKYHSDIRIIKDEQEYNAKSIMGLLSLGIAKGEKIVLKAEGEDEEEAVKGLIKLIKNRLNN